MTSEHDRRCICTACTSARFELIQIAQTLTTPIQTPTLASHLFPATSSNASPSVFIPSTGPECPGYCALVLIRPAAWNKFLTDVPADPYFFEVQSWMARNWGSLETGRFSVTIGLKPRREFNPASPYGHISKNKDGLTITQLLTLTGHFRVGAETSDLNSASVSVLPTRRLNFISRSVSSGSENRGSVFTLDFANQKKIREVTSIWPVVSFSSLSVTLLPTVEMSSVSASIAFAWHFAGDAPPSSRDQVLNLENSGVFTFSASLPGALPSDRSIALPSDAAFASTFKSPGSQDLHPSLTLVIVPSVFPGHVLEPNTVLLEVLTTVTVKIGL